MPGSGERVLRPSRGKQAAFLALSLGFTAGGGWMIARGAEHGWFVLGFFGLCSFVFVLQLLPNASWLRLTDEGFVVRSLFRTGKLVRWRDVARFVPGRMHGNACVYYNYSFEYTGQKTGRAVAGALVGAEAMLPDTYGMKAEALAAVMEDWRMRATKPASPTPR
jgi:hypothetical protein